MLSKAFMTTHEIAELLKVSEATVRSWIHQRDLRAVRFGREFRIAVKDLEDFVNAHATKPASGRQGSGRQGSGRQGSGRQGSGRQGSGRQGETD